MRHWIGPMAALALWPGAALAGLEICNGTVERLSVAVGYKSGGDWVSEGWWNLDPDACVEPVAGVLSNRYYYYRATAAGRVVAGGAYEFCTQTAAHTIVGDTACAARGYATAGFAVIDTGETATRHTHRIEGKPAGRKQAAAKSAAATAAAPRGTRSGLVRGQHGEPFSSRLMFQGCDFHDGFEACTFIGNGWKYFAGYDDPTPRAFLARFETLPLNTPVAVTGDLFAHGDSSAQLAISAAEILAGQDSYAHLRRAMQGNWVSADDANETLYIQGAEMHRYYRQGHVDTIYLDVAPDCPDSAGAGPVMIQTSAQHRDSYCYLIDNVAGGWMDLILMGHEARVSYRKTD
ncbi:DUF1036 domain-containing protein [Roseovarius salis]|uniref:DUF1036 domain-containing protein n=1 Tax=Roseovarius salis TaxID=3376063 RepID=UPI0037CAA0DD